MTETAPDLVYGTNLNVDRGELARAAGPAPLRPWTLLEYDTRRFPFAPILGRDAFRAPRLDRLHEYILERHARLGSSKRLGTQDNIAGGRLMQLQPDDADFWKLYHGFMLHVLAPWVGRGISYTSHPKLRVHLVGTASVSSFHHDICVTKRIDQVNFWMPFTDVDGGATIWLESDYGAQDYRPVPVRYGQVLVFDGGYLGHGSVRNTSGVTRVSLDMRFSYKGAATRADGVALMNRMIQVSDQQGATKAPPTTTPEEESRHV